MPCANRQSQRGSARSRRNAAGTPYASSRPRGPGAALLPSRAASASATATSSTDSSSVRCVPTAGISQKPEPIAPSVVPSVFTA